MRWSYEHLMEAWENLRSQCETREQFAQQRDALFKEAGWDKLEFYKEIDKRNYCAWEKDIRKHDSKSGESGSY